ncbi:hypothetical protein [Ornithinimicrobium kibberense]|uniref:hypothetical protein n=1 Tax=Ornithinimicrobium kibberense TaxID=282060 RepID=UPI00361B8304
MVHLSARYWPLRRSRARRPYLGVRGRPWGVGCCSASRDCSYLSHGGSETAAERGRLTAQRT